MISLLGEIERLASARPLDERGRSISAVRDIPGRACASVATHPSSVALAEALPRPAALPD